MQNNKNNPLSTVLFLALVLVICLLFAFYSQTGTASVLYSICFERADSDTLLKQDADWYGSDELRALQEQSVQAGKAALENLEHSVISFDAETAGARYIQGSTRLEADFYNADSDKTAVLLHAYERGRDFAARWADFWVQRGYNVLIPQMRGHDGNESITTLGFYEQFDLYDLLRAAQERTGVNSYVLHGEGMGANAALLLCGNAALMEKLEGITIELVAAESASTDMMTLVTHQAARQFEMSGPLERFAMKFTINQKLGFSPESVSITAAAAASGTPTLFIVGEDDGFAPPEHTQTLYDACAAEKQLLRAQGVSHGAAWERARSEYEAALESMLGA